MFHPLLYIYLLRKISFLLCFFASMLFLFSSVFQAKKIYLTTVLSGADNHREVIEKNNHVNEKKAKWCAHSGAVLLMIGFLIQFFWL